MANTQYGIRKAEHIEQLPEIDLLAVPHNGKHLVSARFGQNSYSSNTNAMGQHYRNSAEFPNVTFRPATTAESISIASYDFEKLAKHEIFNPRWLQAGRIVRDSEGVYANPLTAIKRDGVDEVELKRLLKNAKKVDGIWFGDNDFAFTPYGFKEGEQTAQEFAEGRLARLLTHTQGKVASKLLSMAKTYKNENCDSVNVVCFDKTNKPVSRVVELGSGGGLLRVDGDDWDDNDDGGGGGFAFGKLKEGEN
jgi:hypothetical protein